MGGHRFIAAAFQTVSETVSVDFPENELKNDTRPESAHITADSGRWTNPEKRATLDRLMLRISASFDDFISQTAAQFHLEQRSLLTKLSQQGRAGGYYEEWSRDDKKDDGQSAPR